MSHRKNCGNTKYVLDGHLFMEIDGKWKLLKTHGKRWDLPKLAIPLFKVMSLYFSNIHISDTQIGRWCLWIIYIYINVAVSCKRCPPSLPYIIIVQTCGKRWDLPKFVDVLSVNLRFSRLLTYNIDDSGHIQMLLLSFLSKQNIFATEQGQQKMATRVWGQKFGHIARVCWCCWIFLPPKWSVCPPWKPSRLKFLGIRSFRWRIQHIANVRHIDITRS